MRFLRLLTLQIIENRLSVEAARTTVLARAAFAREKAARRGHRRGPRKLSKFEEWIAPNCAPCQSEMP